MALFRAKYASPFGESTSQFEVHDSLLVGLTPDEEWRVIDEHCVKHIGLGTLIPSDSMYGWTRVLPNAQPELSPLAKKLLGTRSIDDLPQRTDDRILLQMLNQAKEGLDEGAIGWVSAGLENMIDLVLRRMLEGAEVSNTTQSPDGAAQEVEK